jgi:hypothetical protein
MCIFTGILVLANRIILLVCPLFINMRFLEAVSLINIHFMYFRIILSLQVIKLGPTFVLVWVHVFWTNSFFSQKNEIDFYEIN